MHSFCNFALNAKLVWTPCYCWMYFALYFHSLLSAESKKAGKLMILLGKLLLYFPFIRYIKEEKGSKAYTCSSVSITFEVYFHSLNTFCPKIHILSPQDYWKVSPSFSPFI